MAIAGPDGVDAAIKAGVDLDGSPIPAPMLALYNEVMDLESQRARSGVLKSMRNRVVKTGAKHFDRESLNQRLLDASRLPSTSADPGVERPQALLGSPLTELLHGVDHLLLELLQSIRLTEVDSFTGGVLGQVLEVKGPFTVGQELNR